MERLIYFQATPKQQEHAEQRNGIVNGDDFDGTSFAEPIEMSEIGKGLRLTSVGKDGANQTTSRK